MTTNRMSIASETGPITDGMSMEKMRLMIHEALRNSDDYRTVGGIARSTVLTREQVVSVMNAHPNDFREAPYQIAGKCLYTLSDVCEPALV